MGISLSIRAGIGVSSFNSLNLALSGSLGLTIGTITTALNALFLIVYMALDRFRNPARYALQAAASFFIGRVIDFFVYGAFARLAPDSYALRIALFVLGTLISGSSTGVILHLKSLSFPIESACAELAYRTGRSFKRYRYALDGVFVLSSLALSLALGLPFYVREGTVISMCLLTAVIGTSKRLCERWGAARAENRFVPNPAARGSEDLS